MPFPFLSPEWFDAAAAIREAHRDDAPEITQTIQLNLVVTGVPFTEEPVEAHLDTSSGEMVFAAGSLEGAAATITTDYATAKAMFVDQDQAAGMQAFLGGKIQIQGDMMKLMGLQAAIPATEATEQIAEELKAITE